MSYKLVLKDASWQIIGRLFSAIAGLLVIKIITPYLGPLRFGDYSTILKYFTMWSALADFGMYVIALKKLGAYKNSHDKFEDIGNESKEKLETLYSKFVSTRFFMISIVYTLALVIAYIIPAYTSNLYLIWGLPLGMIFSASFMTAGILQTPLQLFWKMEQLTFALISARSTQLIIIFLVVFLLFSNISFEKTSNISIIVFLLILLSVVSSGVVQSLYVYIKGKKYLPYKPTFDKDFTKDIIKENRQYGLAYYLSSFHTVIVLILLSIIYPTSQNFEYSGIWALALSLIEIFLIVPAALGNSMIHKVSPLKIKEKLQKFGYLLTLIFWIGGILLINFFIFSSNIIYFIGGEKFISDGSIGSDYILPFLAIVLLLSFIKQIFNYIFVSTENQNKLLNINVFGIVIGLIVGLPLILKYNIIGGIVTQLTFEILFVLGAIFIAYKKKVLPIVPLKNFSLISAIIIIFLIGGYWIINLQPENTLNFFLLAIIFNIILIGISYKPVKEVSKNL